MQLEHSFTVPVPADRAWAVLTDIERIAPCMPGATLTEVRDDGEEFAGEVKVKVGPMQVTYQGTARFTELDEDARAATLEAQGDQQRGAGTARATIRATLVEEGDDTTVTVTTDLDITGRPAQFGRGVMEDVGEQLLGEFADCLAEEVADAGDGGGPAGADAGGGEAGAAANGDGTADAGSDAAGAASRRAPGAPRRTDDTIDLMQVAGPSIAKRLGPVIAGLAVLALVIWWFTRGDDDGDG